MGAVAVTKFTGPRFSPMWDNFRTQLASCVFSSSYATGGDTVDPTLLDFREVSAILVVGGLTSLVNLGLASSILVGQNTSGLTIELGGTLQAPKLVAYDSNGAEVANATNLSARNPATIMFVGR